MGFILPIISFVTRFSLFFRIMGILTVLIGIGASIRHSGVVAERSKYQQEIIKGIEIREGVAQEIMSLSDDELNKRLSVWLRD